MRRDQALHRVGRGMRCCLECGETDTTTFRIEHTKRRVVCADERDGALQHQRRNIAKIGTSVKRVSDLEQRSFGFSLALLVSEESRVLVTNRNLAGNRLKK